MVTSAYRIYCQRAFDQFGQIDVVVDIEVNYKNVGERGLPTD